MNDVYGHRSRRDANPLHRQCRSPFSLPLHFLADCKTGLGDDDGSPLYQRTFRLLHSFLFTRQYPQDEPPTGFVDTAVTSNLSRMATENTRPRRCVSIAHRGRYRLPVEVPVVSAVPLKDKDLKSLVKLAKMRGLAGWKSMRKEQLVKALNRTRKPQPKIKPMKPTRGLGMRAMVTRRALVTPSGAKS